MAGSTQTPVEAYVPAYHELHADVGADAAAPAAPAASVPLLSDADQPPTHPMTTTSRKATSAFTLGYTLSPSCVRSKTTDWMWNIRADLGKDRYGTWTLRMAIPSAHNDAIRAGLAERSPTALDDRRRLRQTALTTGVSDSKVARALSVYVQTVVSAAGAPTSLAEATMTFAGRWAAASA